MSSMMAVDNNNTLLFLRSYDSSQEQEAVIVIPTHRLSELLLLSSSDSLPSSSFRCLDENNCLLLLLSAVLKQLSEKLDSVRDVAGKCLVRLLFLFKHLDIVTKEDELLLLLLEDRKEMESIVWSRLGLLLLSQRYNNNN